MNSIYIDLARQGATAMFTATTSAASTPSSTASRGNYVSV